MPGGILQFSYIPILADPTTRLAMIVPCQYWEPKFRQEWEQAAKATTNEWKLQFNNGKFDRGTDYRAGRNLYRAQVLPQLKA